MKRHIRWTLVLACISSLTTWPQDTFASNDPLPAVGARAVGLGYAYTAMRGDIWSLFHNPAGITGSNSVQVGVYLEQRFLLKELSYGHAGAIFPIFKNQAAGVEISSFGFDAYRENLAAVSYGITVLDKISVGAKLAYANLNIPGYGAAGTVLVQMGAHTQINSQLSLGVSAFNVNRATFLTQGRREILPSHLTAGLAYQPTDKVLVVVDVQKALEFPVSFRGGIEYQLHEILYARIGVSTEPLTLTGGLGVNWKQIKVDFSSSYTERLGYTPHISLSYGFGG
ncbi:MAG: hypothetical protein AAF587_10675 [Bacteroidota bacterium]